MLKCPDMNYKLCSDVWLAWLPVVTMADFSAAGDQSGCRAFSSTMMPATCGVAIDVPEKSAYESFLAAKMLAPGAATSGC